MSAIFFALISYLGWGVGDIFGTMASRKIGGYSTTFWYLAFQLPLFGLFTPFFLENLKNLTPGLLIVNIVLGIIGTISLITFFEGLRVGNASMVGTIAASFAAVTVVLSAIFLKESITIHQTIAILIIFLGLILSTLNFREIRIGNSSGRLGIFLAVVTMILWGVYYTFIKIPIREIGWFWPGVISLSSLIIVPLFMRWRKIKLNKPNKKGALLPLIASAVLLGLGTFSFYYALDIGLTSIVTPIAGSYPTLFVVLAFLIFKDPIKRQQIAGIVTTLIGIVLLSLFSV